MGSWPFCGFREICFLHEQAPDGLNEETDAENQLGRGQDTRRLLRYG